MDYFFKTTNFYGYERGQFELLMGQYKITHIPNSDNYKATIERLHGGPANLFIFTEDEVRNFIYYYPGDLKIESYDGYRSLFIPTAGKAAMCIQRSVRKYLKNLKWNRIGLAVMAVLAPILYHPKSPYMLRIFANDL